MLKQIDGFDNYFINEDGIVYSFCYNHQKQLKKSVSRNGYEMVGLFDNTTKKQKMYYVHRLLAQTFIPNPENKPCVNHKDGNKLHNSLDNLQWCTYSENTQHAYKVLGFIPYHLSEEEKKARKIEKIKEYNIKHNIVCVETKKIFRNMIAVAKELNCSRQAIKQAVDSGGACKGFHFVKLKDIIA